MPIDGIFIIGAMLGIVFLHAPSMVRRGFGLVPAVAGVYLVVR